MKNIDFKTARILVTRTDRLGDVLLATPVLKKIKETYPEAKISFLVQKQWMPILQYDLLKDGSQVELIEYQPEMQASELAEIFKAKKFEVAIVLRDEKKITKAVKRAKIAVRVGPYSSLRSFFAFNAGLLQRRSLCKMHEAEYNLELLTKIGIPFQSQVLPTVRSWVSFSDHARQKIALEFKSAGYIALHPGSSGSSRYVSQSTLQALAQSLIAKGESVVITGGPHEHALLKAFKTAVPAVTIFGGEEPRTLDELAALYERASVVVAHGTGPLHLAAAVGAPTFGIFPPLFVLSETRWGALSNSRYTWVPLSVQCPEKYRCRGAKCVYYDCMDRFQVDEAIAILVKMKRKGPHS